jgi:hypothetical protein
MNSFLDVQFTPPLTSFTSFADYFDLSFISSFQHFTVIFHINDFPLLNANHSKVLNPS